MNDRAGGVKGYAEGAAVRLWPRFSCTSFWDRGAVVALRRGSRKAIAAHHEYLGSGLLAERLEAVAAPPDEAAKLSLGGEEIFVAVTRV